MKFALHTILILALGFLAHRFFPFWSIAVVAGVTGIFFPYKNSAASFGAGFAAGSLLWGTYATLLNVANLNVLAGELGQLFHVSGTYLAYVSGLAGGLLAGLGSMTGTLGRKMFERKQVELAG